MRRLLTRLLAVTAAATLATAGAVAVAAPASAAACSGTTGVTVVVDFGSSTTVACAPGDPTSGLDALAKAGFSVTQVQRQPGFVCRINGSPSSVGCVTTPPASAYWAYFHAPRGGSWTYSSLGAGSYDPKPGSVEGWSFGSGGAPGTVPPAKTVTSTPKPTSIPKKTSTPTSTPRKTTSAPRTTSGSSSTKGSTSSSSSASSSKAPTTTKAPTPGASASATPSGAASASASASPSATAAATPGAEPSDTPSLAAAPTSTEAADSGGSLGTLAVGAALVLLVGGGALWVSRRRAG
ncbi:hypothetical protein [Arthrobacter sp. NEB 688]|uniref:hypothetical protein n=1 Tax=Arthrobacter sp. NEB 688 TaxID=904039 RepID=UPI0015631677|nr:hypothetical protein [Arthrobacter sp. NEB 688]QKE85331.1 hypothetical protein HL663_16215 [Arthrobacter sp. NEB 688]